MAKRIQLQIACAMLVTLACPARADEETEALRAQVKALEARLDTLERKEAALQAKLQAQPKPLAAVAPAYAPAPVSATASVIAPAPVAAPSSMPLEQRVTTLEQQQAAATAAAAAQASTTATVHYDYGKGLTVTSPDDRLKLHLGGYFQADDHTFLADMPKGNNDQFYLRSARTIMEAQYDAFSARLMMDFGNGTTQLLDAYGDYNAFDALALRVGKFKDPIGIERWQSEQNVLFVERGMTTNLVPYRDNGIGLHGNLIPGALEYQLTLTNGGADLVNETNGLDNDTTVTGRVFAHPFHGTDSSLLQGVGVGVAGSLGNHSDSVSNPNLTSGYVTPAQSKFFTYNTSAFASGEQWRFNPEATYYNGPFSVISEYVVESEGLRDGAVSRDIENSAWMATATYVLTGENASFDGVIPHSNFDPVHNQWGAFEVVGRYSRLRVDSDAFPVFASPTASADAARESTLGGTWYLNPNVKLNLDFAFTQFNGGATDGNRPDEKAILSRAQVRF
jgi:phosphate-selective porin OprO/OprP